MKNKKKKKWTKKRHRFIRNFLEIILGPYIRKKYSVDIIPFEGADKRPYLVLYNHQTAFDQFFVGLCVKGPIYYVASEDLFSMGFTSKVIKYLVEPIPIKKQSTDVRAVLNCMKVAKEGGTIAIAPEGNRTYSGRTGYMNPAIGQLAKKLGLPIALLRIEGGYGIHPRWADEVRGGRMKAYVSEVIEPEVIAEMSADELYDAICKGLYVDEAVADAEFSAKNGAEYLERVIYVCPKCGLSRFESKGDILRCTRCNLSARYLPTKEFQWTDGEEGFRFVAEWYDYQCQYVNSLDLNSLTDNPIYIDDVSFSEVILYKKKKLLEKDAKVTLYGDRIEITSQKLSITVPFGAASVFAVLGKNKLNVYIKDTVYQLKGDSRFNALKFVNLFYRYKNLESGSSESTFLGI